MLRYRAHRRLLPLALAAVSLAVGVTGIVWTFPEGALTTAFQLPAQRGAIPLEALAPPPPPIDAVSESTPPTLDSAAAGATPAAAHSGTFKTAYEPPAPLSAAPSTPATATPATPAPTQDAPATQPPRYNPAEAQVVSTPTPVGKYIVKSAPPPSPTPVKPTPTATPRPVVSSPSSTPETRPGNSGDAPGHNKTAGVAAPDVKKDSPKSKKK